MTHSTHSFRFSASDIGVFSSSAAPAVAGLSRGGSVVGLTDGSFSLIDILREILTKTGPADVVSATWSAGIKDLTNVEWMLTSHLIRSFRLVLDRTYPRMRRKYVAPIDELFPPEVIRTSDIHAKFLLVGNEEWSVTVLSSMNLNANRRVESFQIIDNPEVYEVFHSFVEDLFKDKAEGLDCSFQRAREHMDRFFGKHALKAEQAAEKRFFDDSPRVFQ